jgi:glutaredoxin
MLALIVCLVQPIDFWGSKPKEPKPAPLWSAGERPAGPVAEFLERPTRETALRYLAWQKDRLARLQAATKILEEVQIEAAPKDAPILYFTRDGCPWCEKQDAVLKDMAVAVRRVTPDEPELWKKHKVTATPTLVIPGREPLVGFRNRKQLEEVLK